MPPGIKPRVIHYYVSPLRLKLQKLLYLILKYRYSTINTSSARKKNKILYRLAKTLMTIISPEQAKDILYHLGLSADILEVMGDNEAYLVLAQKLLLLNNKAIMSCSGEHQYKTTGNTQNTLSQPPTTTCVTY